MKISKKLLIAVLIFSSIAIPSFAGVIVNTPVNNSHVSSPFSLSAFTSLCSGQQVSATGYSLDSSTYTAIFNAPSITTTVSAAAGGHILHVKAWGVSGAACVTDVADYCWCVFTRSVLCKQCEQYSEFRRLDINP